MNESVLVGIVILLIAGIVGRFLYKKDTEKEDQRRAANRLAGFLRAGGLQYIPEFLEDYGVGDYSGMAKIIKKAAALLDHEDVAKALFTKTVERVLAAKAGEEATKPKESTPATDAALAAAKKKVADAA